MGVDGPTVLVVDDDGGIRASIIGYLEDSGFRTVEAANGMQGIEACRRQQPSLVLCDLRMPGMDGLDVLATLRREFAEMPIIVVSGMGGLGDAIEALKRGAWDYLTKPIHDMAVLEHAVRKALERARLLQENRKYAEHLEKINRKLRISLQQMQEDEEAGRRIQFQMLPDDGTVYDGYRFSRRLLTSTYLSGDFVDYFRIDEGHVGFYIADVSGHGVSSAFVTVLLKSKMNRYLELYRQDRDPAILQPSTVLRRINEHMVRGKLGKYLTMFYGVIDTRGNCMRFSNGGQFPYPILYDGGSAAYVSCKSLPVGLFDFAEYHEIELELPESFVMLLISDGILDVLPQPNLQQKEDFVLSLMGSQREELDTVLEHTGLAERAKLPDDVTLLMVRRDA